MNIGDRVHAIRNGFVEIDATEVMDKWSIEFEQHPTSCATAARIENVVTL